MQTKKLFFGFLLTGSVLNTQAQQTASPQQLYSQGKAYMLGIGKPYDPPKALELYRQSARMGNAQAMTALGNMNAMGIAVPVNSDSAFYWYQTAANKGSAGACYNLGQIYKTGNNGTRQDFAVAARYYQQGASLNDIDCKNALGYMCYKGFGVPQDYVRAFKLFKEVASKGNENAMYFLGLCYRNGYGTPVDIALAKQWLSRSAMRKEKQAVHELVEEPVPENLSTISTTFDQELKMLKGYKEKYHAFGNDNNYEGSYTGYAVYYDWSGKFISEIVPLKLDLKKEAAGYAGKWQEGEASPASIGLKADGNTFTFNSGSAYTRTNHYSDRHIEKWEFDKAQLELGFVGDSIELSGYVQFYSPKRSEPGKPLQVILKKANDGTGDAGVENLSLYPNPASTQTTLQFTLFQSAQIAITLSSINGTRLFVEEAKRLPAGTYTYSIPIGNYASGTYIVSIIANDRIAQTKSLMKK